MGENKQFRSEESRKNYEKQEQRRMQAIARKERQAKVDALKDRCKTWLKQNPMKAIAILVAAALVIALVCVGGKALFNPLAGKQDNWLILNTAASGKANYQHLADFAIPAGFTLDDYSLLDDGVSQDFFCIAEDENAPVQDVYISGTTGIVASEYPATVLEYGFHQAAGEPRTLTIGGRECSALYLISNEAAWSGEAEGIAIAHMSFYFATDTDATITATLRSGTLPVEQLPDEATMLAEAERILDGLTILK